MNVTVYSTSNCGICQGEMQWLDSIGVTYIKKIVDEDDSAMDDFMAVNDGMIGVPFTVIENEDTVTKVSGFDRAKIQQALDHK